MTNIPICDDLTSSYILPPSDLVLEELEPLVSLDSLGCFPDEGDAGGTALDPEGSNSFVCGPVPTAGVRTEASQGVDTMPPSGENVMPNTAVLGQQPPPNPQTSKAKKKKSKSAYKHVPHREKPPHLVARRNARERRRVQAVNVAFARLRRYVPFPSSRGKRVSKVKTLQSTIDYIYHLQDLLQESDDALRDGSLPINNNISLVDHNNALNGVTPWYAHSQDYQDADYLEDNLSEDYVVNY
ncbi:uncharacterized protein LOC143039630 [Oratosquilla oratoria]|uniref:uncharacterized protein LOC143039630 n=1 Tax=Oratosquilla oratoria TaxID=337810 RepID=UPI003F772576